ncbi:MAG: 16S rRNA (guanine(966)-N(2))-methyltransferase RsmD [Eikenella sp.]|nr:16S rRNA (guanine(966)-N(2))-methyltransferase RsmD [Eikenella sp.]
MKTAKHAKHQNQVRIIGGTHRGRKLSFADAEGLRPTPDSVRERLFNWLGQDLSGLNVLDLFAGSGALGFEAASRHARQAVLVEKNRAAAAHLAKQAEVLSLQDKVQSVHAEALSFLSHNRIRFDVVFLDPPFAWQAWPALLAALPVSLADGARIYLEAGRLPVLPPGFEVRKEGKAGMSRHVLLHYASSDVAI